MKKNQTIFRVIRDARPMVLHAMQQVQVKH